jgi:polar amino acid transport system substrate-binding protein
MRVRNSEPGLVTRFPRTLLAAGLSAWLCVTATAAEPLRLVTGNAAPFTTEQRDGFFDLIVAEMFARLGVHAEVRTHASSARALVNADRGEDDGLVARIRGLEAPYPNLVIVPEKIFDNDFVAFALGQTFATPDWRALESRHVAYIRGWQIFETNLAGHRQVTRVSDAGQLFELLRRQRAEVGLYERWQALWHARAQALPVRLLEPPLARAEMFAYLHRKHAPLAPRAAQALAAMKRDGSYARIFDATLARLESRQPPR